jgi:hypothetical protein
LAKSVSDRVSRSTLRIEERVAMLEIAQSYMKLAARLERGAAHRADDQDPLAAVRTHNFNDTSISLEDRVGRQFSHDVDSPRRTAVILIGLPSLRAKVISQSSAPAALACLPR